MSNKVKNGSFCELFQLVEQGRATGTSLLELRPTGTKLPMHNTVRSFTTEVSQKAISVICRQTRRPSLYFRGLLYVKEWYI